MNFIIEYIDLICWMWPLSRDVKWWEMLLVGLAILIADLVIFWAMWFMRQEVAIECGYPRRKRKYMKKMMSTHSFWDRITLLRLTREAESKGVMLYLNFVFHCLAVLALIASIVGFIGCMITLADGWAFGLLLMPEITVFFVTTILEFVPHLIFLKSARDKYKP